MSALHLTLPLAGIELKSPEGPQWEFLVLFAVVIFGPAIVSKAKIPGIIGLLIGGFVIGPHGLDLITSGNTTVPELGKLGLLYLMFVAGVELDLHILSIHRRSAITFGIATFAFPMAFGTIAGFALNFDTEASLLLGSLLASHTLLLYPLVRAAGLANDPAIASGVGATVLTDTLSLVVLAAISSIVTGGGSAATITVQIVLGLTVLLVFSMVVLPRLVRLAFRTLGTEKYVRYVIAVASFLSAATVAEIFGIEGIVGAFFAGLAMNRMVPNEGPLMDRIDFFGGAVFIPVFMVSVGLLLDPAVMFQPTTLGYAALFILACTGGKIIAAQLMRPTLGFSRAEAMTLFALSTPQAAATLASVIVGFDIGLFSEVVVNATLVLILFSIVLATLVIQRSTKDVEPPVPGEAALGARILVAVTDLARAPSAFRLASRIARVDSGTLHGVLARSFADPPTPHGALTLLEAAARATGSETDPRALVHDSLPKGLAHGALAEDASLILASPDEDAESLAEWSDAADPPVPLGVIRGDAAHANRVLVSGGNGVARELATRLAGGKPESVPELRLSDLNRGELGVLALDSVHELATLGPPPAGAGALLVVAPSDDEESRD